MERRRASIFNTVLSVSAVVISIATVGVTSVQTYAAQKQVQIAEKQIEEIGEQFVRAGPIVTASSELRLEVGEVSDEIDEGDASYKDFEAPVVNMAVINGHSAVHFVVEVANEGRSTTTIQSVGLKTGPDEYIFAEIIQLDNYVVYCGVEAQQSKNCAYELPYELGPGKTYKIFFLIGQWEYESITSHGVGANGLIVEIQAVGIPQEPLRYVSSVRVSK